MILKMTSSAIAAVGLLAGISACGTSGDNGTGESGQPTCQEAERRWFVACWKTDASGDALSASDLSVLGPAAPDDSLVDCFPPSSARDRATVPFMGWELEDTDGNPWLIQFSIEGATSDLLAPGDIVDFKFLADAGGVERAPQGHVALERDGRPVIALGINEAPYGIAVDPAEAACEEDGSADCGVQSSARVTVGTESEVVSIGEVSEIDDLAITPGYYRDTRDCESLPGGYVPDWLELGVYSAR